MTERFTDLDITFTMHPRTKDLITVVDEKAVRQALKNLILTKPTERVFAPLFGTRVSRMLFELPSPFIENEISREIENAINTYEPRVLLIQPVVVRYNNETDSYVIHISYSLINIADPLTLEITLDRVR